jgi:DNA-nicking Smr family endonuclease
VSRRPAEPLTPHDRLLWRRLAATVRPLRPAPADEPATPPAEAAPPARSDKFVSGPGDFVVYVPRAPDRADGGPAPPTGPPPPPLPPPPPSPLAAATLDGVWDRRLAQGRVEPELVLDLHGHGEAAAHALVERRLAEAAARGLRVVLVVTGKGLRGHAAPDPRGRGLLRRRLPDWLELARTRPLVAAIRPAHPRHGGGGAFYVVLKRPR